MRIFSLGRKNNILIYKKKSVINFFDRKATITSGGLLFVVDVRGFLVVVIDTVLLLAALGLN